jgi:hypothetical protein
MRQPFASAFSSFILPAGVPGSGTADPRRFARDIRCRAMNTLPEMTELAGQTARRSGCALARFVTAGNEAQSVQVL